MQMARKFGKVAAVLAIAGALAGASPAFGDAGENVTSRITDGYGNEKAFAYSWESYGNKNVAVRDTNSNLKYPYAEYDRVNTHGLRLDNTKGEGTTVYSGSSYTNYVQKVTVCLNVGGQPDPCGPDDRPGDGR